MLRRLRVLLSAFGVAVLAAGAFASDEPVARMQLLWNGDFRERTAPADVDPRFALAWWRSNHGALTVEAREGRAPALVLRGSQTASQPIAAFAPLAGELVMRGRVRGAGVVTLVDGRGVRARVTPAAQDRSVPPSVTGDPDAATAFELPFDAFVRAAGEPLVPRFVLELSTDGEARFEELEVLVAFPLPSRDALRTEVIARTREIVDTWLERGADREGPRETAFLPHLFDALTGERLQTYPAGLHPLFEELLRIAPLELEPRWALALERYVEDFLALAIDPGSGLPRTWDTLRDEPAHGSFEIAAPLRFLIDASERGPDATRERCAQAALRIGGWILTKGVMPDGSIAPVYDSRDGEPSTQAQPLRRLDLAAQLARLAALGRTGRPASGHRSFEDVAHTALLALEFTHDWPGTFDAIDPGFDDDFGHYGARAVVMCRALPAFALARDFARSGFERYAPLWRDGARHGGSMAADQVRCWDTLLDFAEIEPRVAAELPALLDAAVRAHLAGEQYGGGAWGDVTYSGFDPRVDIAVGDLPGAPANLLRGLALAMGRTSTLGEDDVRALFTGVLRSTVETYRRPFGYLRTQRPSADRNDAYASLRVLPALTTMLVRLSD